MRVILTLLCLAATPVFAFLPDGTHVLFTAHSDPNELRLYRWAAEKDGTAGHFDLVLVGSHPKSTYSPSLLHDGDRTILLTRSHDTRGLLRFESVADPATVVTGTVLPFESYATPHPFSSTELLFWDDTGASIVDHRGNVRLVFPTKPLTGNQSHYVRFQRIDDDQVMALASLYSGNFEAILLQLTADGPKVLKQRSVTLPGFSIHGFFFAGFDHLWGFSHRIQEQHDYGRHGLFMDRMESDPYQLFQSSNGKSVKDHGDARSEVGEVLGADAVSASIRRGWELVRFDGQTFHRTDFAKHPACPVDRKKFHLQEIWFPPGDFAETTYDEAPLGAAFRVWKKEFLADWQRHQAQARRPFDGRLPARVTLMDVRMMDFAMAGSLSTLKHVPSTVLAKHGMRLWHNLVEPLPEHQFGDIAVTDLARLATSCATAMAAQ